jgi:hypothetical protein
MPGTLGQRWQYALGKSIQDKNLSRNNNPGLFGSKIARDLAIDFLMLAALIVSLSIFLNSSGDFNHNVSGLFCHFSHFFCFSYIS